MAWWALFSPTIGNMITEQCEKCKSTNIELGANYTEKLENGRIAYYAKYFCRKCGNTCFVQEIWENNQALDFEKTEK